MNETRKAKAAICIITVGLWLIFGQSPDVLTAQIEEVKKSVVKITVEKPGNVIETGAGVILSTKRQIIFILTAYHVVEEAENIFVRFYEYPAEQFQGNPFEKYDAENDLAVIYVSGLNIPQKISQLHLGDPSKVNELDKVIAVGHPSANEWEFSSGEVRSIELTQFRFSGDAVEPGNSGGALLNEELQLIGLIMKERPRDGIALKIDDALEILKKWKIPYEFKSRGKTWPWIVVGAGVAGGITAFLTISGNGNTELGTLKITVPDPSN